MSDCEHLKAELVSEYSISICTEMVKKLSVLLSHICMQPYCYPSIECNMVINLPCAQ